MKTALLHLKANIFRGLLAALPLGLTFLILRFLYLAVDQTTARPVERWIGRRIPGLGLLLVLAGLYLLGLAVSHWAGRKFFSLVERASARIPLIKTIYGLGRQLGTAFSRPEKEGLKRVVLVEHFRPGVWSVGFVMGSMRDGRTGGLLLRLFVPTAPNPTSGFMIIVPEESVREAGWTVSEGINTVLSGGLTGPDRLE